MGNYQKGLVVKILFNTQEAAEDLRELAEHFGVDTPGEVIRELIRMGKWMHYEIVEGSLFHLQRGEVVAMIDPFLIQIEQVDVDDLEDHGWSLTEDGWVSEDPAAGL